MEDVSSIITTIGANEVARLILVALVLYLGLIAISLLVGAVIHMRRGTSFKISFGFGKWSHEIIAVGRSVKRGTK